MVFYIQVLLLILVYWFGCPQKEGSIVEQSNNKGKIFAQQWSQKPCPDSLPFINYHGSSLFNLIVTTHIDSINFANGFVTFKFICNCLSLSLDSYTRKAPLQTNPTIKEKCLHPRWCKIDKGLICRSTYWKMVEISLPF